MGDATLGFADAGWEALFRGSSEAGFTGFWDLTGLCQFTNVRIRSGNRQKQDLPDFGLDRIVSVHQRAYSLRQSSEAGFTGFWDWTGLCQFTNVRIRSGNRQKQDLPDFGIGQDCVSSPTCVLAPEIVRSRICGISGFGRIGSDSSRNGFNPGNPLILKILILTNATAVIDRKCDGSPGSVRRSSTGGPI